MRTTIVRTGESAEPSTPAPGAVAPRAGVLAALWLPTHADGTLDRPAMSRHVSWLATTGIHGVLALGSTGEFVRLGSAEREAALEAIIEDAAPLPVVTNVSSIRLDEVIALGRGAKRLGSVGVALMPPSFYPVSQADLLEFFLRAADGIDLPFYLYNFPELTGNRINIETVAAFAERAPMAGIKQSGGEFDYHRDLIALGREKDFSVFSGSDTRLLEVFGLGAAGAIGGLVNMVPELMVEIYRICREGVPGDGSVAAERMREVGRVVDRLTFPLNVACGIEARGFDPGHPKTVVSAESTRLYGELVTEFRSVFTSWGLPIHGSASV